MTDAELLQSVLDVLHQEWEISNADCIKDFRLKGFNLDSALPTKCSVLCLSVPVYRSYKLSDEEWKCEIGKAKFFKDTDVGYLYPSVA